MLTVLLAVASLTGAADQVAAELIWEFSPAPDGGVELNLHFEGVTAEVSGRSDWINLYTTTEMMAGGGVSRGGYHFADTVVSQSVGNGWPIEVDFIRLGNFAGSEQLFIVFAGGFGPDVELNLSLQATWTASNLPFSRMLPGVTTEEYPRLGGSMIVIDAGDGALPADANGDGLVDSADHEAWRAGYGASLTPGFGPDANGDGTVDAADYTTWRDVASSASAGLTVPEPAGLVLAVAASSLALVSRRRFATPT